MNNIIRAFSGLFEFLGKYFRFLPYGFTGIFIITNLLINLYYHGSTYAFIILAKTLLSVELVINENVHKAILNQGYGLIQFIEILTSIYIIYLFLRFWVWVQLKFSGSQAEGGSYVIAFIILFIVEITTVRFIDGSFGFVPIKDGLFFLFINLTPVFQNIFIPTASSSVIFLGRKLYK